MNAKIQPGERFCVFCGGAPSDKTKEHVVPRWLLRMTGKPKRQAHFGRDWRSPNLNERKYSWDAFSFPACDACNTRWSSIEANVKRIVEGMMSGDALSADDLCAFLDWMDKVRVGLWLGMYYLNGNYRAIIHQFHIDDRVGQQDRALFIFESREQLEGIGLVGVDSPIFHTMPSALYFIVNHLHFISLSKPFLVAEKFGWPYAQNMRMQDVDTDGFWADFVEGHGKIASAIFEKLPGVSGTILTQPIAHPASRNSPEDAHLYSAPYLQGLSQPGQVGIGKLFVGNASVVPFPEEASLLWRPLETRPANDLAKTLLPWFAALQRELYLDGPSYDHFPEEDRRLRNAEIAGVIKLHDLMVGHELKKEEHMQIARDPN